MNPNLLLFQLLAAAQAAPAPTKEQIALALERSPPDVSVLRSAENDESVTPHLARAFSKQANRTYKLTLAFELARRGDPTGEAVDYLRRRVSETINASGPDSFVYDAKGESIPGAFSEEFLAWCKRQQVDPSEQFGREMAGLAEIDVLTIMRDRESLSIFRRGLAAGPLITERCARGLALVGAEEDIGAVIAKLISQPNRFVRRGFLRALACYESEKARIQISESLSAHPEALETYRQALKEDQRMQALRRMMPAKKPR